MEFGKWFIQIIFIPQRSGPKVGSLLAVSAQRTEKSRFLCCRLKRLSFLTFFLLPLKAKWSVVSSWGI